MNDKVKEKAALARALTKKEQEKIAKLLASAGEGLGRVTPKDIKMRLKMIKSSNKTPRGVNKIKNMAKNAQKKIKNRMTSDAAYNKGGIVKKFKGGLMVKPKAAKRGY